MEFEHDGQFKISRLPRPKITLSKLKYEARTRVDDIFKNQIRLKCILGRYEDVLRKRWTKKTSEQRKQILLSAWPSMPSTHRPDFHELRRKPVPQRQNNPDFKEPFLFPHINLEDLTQSKTILLFVDSRANHTPDTFANSDFNSIHLGLTSQIILPVSVDDKDIWCHMRLTGQKTAETYGHLRHFQDDDAVFDHLTYHYGMEPGEGLLVLEIQQRIMRFLLLCVELILHDMPLNDLSEPVALELLSDSNFVTFERPPLETAIFEAPYRVPDQFDFVRLQSYVYAKRAEAKDHLWSLREDPAYFADTVRDASEHGKNVAFSREASNKSPLLGSYIRENVFTSVAADAYSSFSLWDLIWQDLGRLVAIRDRHCVLNSSGQRLPEDYEGAQCHFSHLVEQGTKTLLDTFRAGVVASPPLRKHFIRSSQDLNPLDLQVVAKSNSHNDHLLWIVNQLADSNMTNLCGLYNLLDELERLIRNDTKQRERISSWVASMISDLAVLGELKRQMELSSPGPAMWGITFVPESKMKEEYSRKTILMTLIAAATSRSIEISGTGDPLKRFKYPLEKRQTAITTREMRSAENELDNFWRQAEVHFEEKAGISLHGLLQSILGHRKLQRTLEWSEPSPIFRAEPPQIDEVMTYGLTSSLEERTESTLVSEEFVKGKVKAKTRGIAIVPMLSNLEIHEDDPIDAVLTPKFKAGKRTSRVFSTLFGRPSEEGIPGELPWKEFLYAMTSLGFSVQKLDGSAWIFSPVDESLERSITFHEPHPVSKIPFRVARRYGRRLEWAYGWTADSFVRA